MIENKFITSDSQHKLRTTTCPKLTKCASRTVYEQIIFLHLDSKTVLK